MLIGVDDAVVASAGRMMLGNIYVVCKQLRSVLEVGIDDTIHGGSLICCKQYEFDEALLAKLPVPISINAVCFDDAGFRSRLVASAALGHVARKREAVDLPALLG